LEWGPATLCCTNITFLFFARQQIFSRNKITSLYTIQEPNEENSATNLPDDSTTQEIYEADPCSNPSMIPSVDSFFLRAYYFVSISFSGFPPIMYHKLCLGSTFCAFCIVIQQLFNQINVRQHHSSAAISLETKFIQRITLYDLSTINKQATIKLDKKFQKNENNPKGLGIFVWCCLNGLHSLCLLCTCFAYPSEKSACRRLRYVSHLFAITLPHVKHRTGMIISQFYQCGALVCLPARVFGLKLSVVVLWSWFIILLVLFGFGARVERPPSERR
jgi:hypothetical protein